MRSGAYRRTSTPSPARRRSPPTARPLRRTGGTPAFRPAGRQRRGRFLVSHPVAALGEVGRVLDAPHHHRLLVVRRSAHPTRSATRRGRSGELRMEDDLRAARRRQPARLGVTPSLVADARCRTSCRPPRRSGATLPARQPVLGRISWFLVWSPSWRRAGRHAGGDLPARGGHVLSAGSSPSSSRARRPRHVRGTRSSATAS